MAVPWVAITPCSLRTPARNATAPWLSCSLNTQWDFIMEGKSSIAKDQKARRTHPHSLLQAEPLLLLLFRLSGHVRDFKWRVNMLPTSTRNTFSCKPLKTHEQCFRNWDRKSGDWWPRAEAKVQKCHREAISSPPSVPFSSIDPSSHDCLLAVRWRPCLHTSYPCSRKEGKGSASHYFFQSVLG